MGACRCVNAKNEDHVSIGKMETADQVCGGSAASAEPAGRFAIAPPCAVLSWGGRNERAPEFSMAGAQSTETLELITQ